MTKRERLEDLGIIKSKIEQILDNPVFDNTDSKHYYYSWIKSYKFEDSEEAHKLHCHLRGLHDAISDVHSIACGDDEI